MRRFTVPAGFAHGRCSRASPPTLARSRTEEPVRIGNIAAKALGALVVLAMLFFGLKSCTVSIWQSADKANSYAVVGGDNRSLRVVFLPHNETMIWYTDPANDFIEGVLTKMRGTYGTHYVWRLWKVEGPGVMFGYRIYPPDTEPIMMEITVLERFMQGRGAPTFPSVGNRTHQVILFGPNAIRFQDMWLQKEPDNPKLVDLLRSKLKNGSAAPN